MRNLEILAIGLGIFGLGILTRFFRLWRRIRISISSVLFSLSLCSVIIFSISLLVAKKIIYIMLLCISCLNTGPRSHYSSISHRRVNLSRNERVNSYFQLVLQSWKYTRDRFVEFWYIIKDDQYNVSLLTQTYDISKILFQTEKEFLSKEILSNLRFVDSICQSFFFSERKTFLSYCCIDR